MQVLAEYLKTKGDFKVFLVEQSGLPPDLSDYCAIITYLHKNLDERVENAIIKYTNNGGRYISLHHFNKAIDTIRKDEQMILEGNGRRTLKNSRWLFLYGQEHLNESQIQRLHKIIEDNHNLYQSYLLKEEFRSIMNGLTGEDGPRAVNRWVETVMITTLDPLKKFARLIKRHFQQILNYFEHPIASGLAEGLNNLIATVKKRAMVIKI